MAEGSPEGPAGLYVRQLGAGGRALLVVHGGPDWDHSYLVPAAERLAMRRRVVLFDLRGCGRSRRYPRAEDYTRAAAAADISALARTLEPPVDLLGFSFGGRLALRAVADQPRLYRSLILASTSVRAEVSWDPEPGERARRREAVEAELARAPPAEDLAQRTRAMALAGLALDVWDRRRLPAIRPVIERVSFSGSWWRAHEAGILAREPPIDDAAVVADGSRPVLILHGEHDFRFPAGDSAWLERYPHVRRTILAAGHFAHLEAEERWCATIEAFLAEVDDDGPRLG